MQPEKPKLVSNFDQHPIPTLPAPRIILPTKGEFEQFYSAARHYGEPNALLNMNGDLILKLAWFEMIISKHSILELIAEKYNQDVIVDKDITIRSPPPFVTGIDDLIKNKLADIEFNFGRIMEMNDSSIQRLVYDYIRVLSYPLMARIEYAKWDKSLLGYQITKAVSKMEDQKNKEIRTIRSDYETKIKDEMSKLTLKINKLVDDVEKYRTSSHGLQDIVDKMKHDADNERGAIEELHGKLRDAERLKTEFEAKWIEEKKARSIIEEKIKKFEGQSEWIADLTCSSERPTFMNRVTNEVLEIPCSMDEFRKEYRLKSTDGEMRLYINENKDELEIPDSFAIKMFDLIKGEPDDEGQEETDKGKKGNKDDLKPADHDIWDIILDSEEPLTDVEIAAKSGKHINNVRSRHLYRLMKNNKIKEEFKDGKKVYISIE